MYVGCIWWCEPPARCRPGSAGWYWSRCTGLRNPVSVCVCLVGCTLLLPEVQRCPWWGGVGVHGLPGPLPPTSANQVCQWCSWCISRCQLVVLLLLLLSEWGTQGPPFPRGQAVPCPGPFSCQLGAEQALL